MCFNTGTRTCFNAGTNDQNHTHRISCGSRCFLPDFEKGRNRGPDEGLSDQALQYVPHSIEYPVADTSTELACGRNHVPFSSLTTNTMEFVSPEYLPEDLSIRDPRNMKKHEIQSFFAHIKHRQDHHGAENAFRFIKALGKNQETLGTDYPDTTHLTQAQVQLLPKKRKGKEKAPDAVALNTRKSALNTRTSALNTDVTSALDEPAPTDTSHNDDAPMAIIDQASMMALVAQGYPPVPPLNGPNDGDPQYAVPTATLQKLNLQALPSRSNAGRHEDMPVDPLLVAPRRRHTRNADAM